MGVGVSLVVVALSGGVGNEGFLGWRLVLAHFDPF
jgi:hypothetical protein